MPRAHRHFLSGHAWHITHRCHQQEFLLKFSKDRSHWVKWLYEAKKRYGLCVLNYTVTSNHIHLLVVDTKASVISSSMQLIAGRTAQQYNLRKHRKGAFWEDRYHATAIESDQHLFQCLAYIDMNMVRAGVVSHPSEWKHGGYHEIQSPPERYSIIDNYKLMELGSFNDMSTLQQAHREWINVQLNQHQRQQAWTDGVAVGSECYVESVQAELGSRGKGRKCQLVNNYYVLKEPETPYKDHYICNMDALSD